MSGMGFILHGKWQRGCHICAKQLWPQFGFDNHLEYIHRKWSSPCEGCGKKCAKVGNVTGPLKEDTYQEGVCIKVLGGGISPSIFIQVYPW